MQNLKKVFDSTVRSQRTIPQTCISKNLEISTSRSELEKIWKLRNEEYNKHYSEFSCNDNDSFDANALVLFSKNTKGKLVSTGRIVFDSLQGLPADSIIHSELTKMRKRGLQIAEISKLAISEEASGVLHEYMQTFYDVAIQQNIDSLLFICKKSSAVVYRRLVGAKMLVNDINYSYGTDFAFSLLEWRVRESKYHQAHKSLEAV